jgi:hypothetical protein
VDSKRDHRTVVEVVGAFVRERTDSAGRQSQMLADTPASVTKPPESEVRPEAANSPSGPNVDVKAALTILGRLPTRAGISRGDLSFSNLAGADLNRADLSGPNLTGADLNSARLRVANLTEADFNSADLTGAQLSWAKLTRGRLWRTNLTNAELVESNLAGAELINADLTDADVDLAKSHAAVSSRTSLTSMLPTRSTAFPRTLR